MRIPQEILNILESCTVNGNVLYLPGEQLERKIYEAVNKCMSDIGGKWNRKAKGHVFSDDPTEALDNLLLTGETEDIRKKFQFFPTPRPVAEYVCDLAELEADSDVLEPSCGDGALADVIYAHEPAHLVGLEINPAMSKTLRSKPYACITETDFLSFVKQPSHRIAPNRIIMNPPFSLQQDIDHVLTAFDILRPGGILVSIMSPSPFFRTNRKSIEFRAWLDTLGAEIYDLPEGAFKASGTMIATKVVKIRKATCAAGTSTDGKGN